MEIESKEVENEKTVSGHLKRGVKWLACKMDKHERKDVVIWNGLTYVTSCRWCGTFMELESLTGKPIKYK